jgi:hypothetical protein
MGPMGGRWVCRRCFASNDPEAATCVRCGLERGADPATAEPQDPQQPQQWAAPTPPPARPMWMQLALRFWWVGLIVVIAVGGWYFSARRDDSGQISTAGNLKINELRIGDCFNLKDPDADVVEEVEARPCTQVHRYEMFHVDSMSGGEYPSDEEFGAWIEQNCLAAFAPYVGVEYQESVLEILPVTPTEDSWDDDKSVQCVLADPGNEQLTTSLRSAAR